MDTQIRGELATPHGVGASCRHLDDRFCQETPLSWRTQTGVGLWLALLLCITFSPLQIYMPMFLQRLRRFDPLAAGFFVATASPAWTAASFATTGASGPWPDCLVMIGRAIMGLSLTLIAYLAPRSAALLLIPATALLAAGIGQCWPSPIASWTTPKPATRLLLPRRCQLSNRSDSGSARRSQGSWTDGRNCR